MSKYGPEIIDNLESMIKDTKEMNAGIKLGVKQLNDLDELLNIFSSENIQEYLSILNDIKNSEGTIDKEIYKRVENLRNKVR